MSSIIILMSEFIERMSNPAYGISVNEDYSFHFAKLMTSDRTESFEKFIFEEARHLDDIDALSTNGWLWFLSWARSKKVELNEELLLSLIDKWSSVFMQVSVIDFATWQADLEWEPLVNTISMKEFQLHNAWLYELLRRSIEALEDDSKYTKKDGRKNFIETQVNRPENTLIALLQVGREITLDAASTLLTHKWYGQAKLLEFFWLRYDGLDEETQQVWKERLRPPKR